MNVARCEVKRIALPSGVKLWTESAPGCHVSRTGATAADRHRVDVGVAVVLRAERDGLSIGRKHRIRLDPIVGRQPPDVGAVEVGDEEIAGIDERDVAGADRRLGQKSGIGRVDARGDG